MHTGKAIIAPLLGAILLFPASAFAARKIKQQVAPAMSAIARRMGLRGTVRLEIEIAADGTVKSDKPLGGHPLLIQSAENAVRKWRFEPGPPAREIIEFNFQPEKEKAER